MISHLKRKLNDFVLAGNDCTTPEHIAEAMQAGKRLNAVSVHILEYKCLKDPNYKIPDIRKFNDFEYTEDGLICRQHNDIGTGYFIKVLKHSRINFE